MHKQHTQEVQQTNWTVPGIVKSRRNKLAETKKREYVSEREGRGDKEVTWLKVLVVLIVVVLGLNDSTRRGRIKGKKGGRTKKACARKAKGRANEGGCSSCHEM